MPKSLVIMLGLLALTACTRGKKKDDSTEKKAAATEQAVQTPEDQGPWARGDLPPEATEGTPHTFGSLIVSIGAEPPSLNVHVDSDWNAAQISSNIYETLVEPDPFDDPLYRMKPVLAERWEISEDKLTYTFYLRKDVKWHDGKPFTARDVIATLDKVMDPTTRAAHVRAYLEELDSYEKVDDYTVRFHWKRPYFLSMDAVGDLQIQPAHYLEKLTGAEYNEAATNRLNRRPVGTGPFRFVDWNSNQKVVLRRNAEYWGDKAHVEQLVFRIVQDPTVAKQLAMRGELDIWTRVLDEDWAKMEPSLSEKFHRSMVFDASYAWIGWNQKAKPFLADRRVRRALTMLLDRRRIADTLYYGLPKPTACTFYWASPACKGIEPLPYDPKQAEALLDEAGWKDSDNDGVRDKDGVPFRFTFMIPASSVNSTKLGTKMKEDYRRYGIDVVLQKVEWTAFTKRLRKHEFDACTLKWGGGPRQDPSQIWHSKAQDGGSNYVGFSNAEADKLIEEARTIFDDDARNALYRKFGQILVDEQPYTFLYVAPQLTLIRKRVHGARESLLWWQFEDMWVDEGEEDLPGRQD